MLQSFTNLWYSSDFNKMQYLQTFVRFIWVHFVLVNLQNNRQISAAVAYGKAEMSKSKKTHLEQQKVNYIQY